MQVILSTRNPSKLEQIKQAFGDSSINILTLDDVGIEGEAKENGQTLFENAYRKAFFAWEKQPADWIEKKLTMADDTGIFIDVLNGFPGVNTASWSGGNTDTDKKTLWILEQLKEHSNRSATFKTVAVVMTPAGQPFRFEGEVKGKILETPRCKAQPKMPYSSIFQPDGFEKVWAEMTTEEENKISHRGKAFRQAREFLEKMLITKTAP